MDVWETRGRLCSSTKAWQNLFCCAAFSRQSRVTHRSLFFFPVRSDQIGIWSSVRVAVPPPKNARFSNGMHRELHNLFIAIRCVEQSVSGYEERTQVNWGWKPCTLPGSAHHSLAIPTKPRQSKKSFRKPFSGSPMRPVAGEALNRLLKTSIGQTFGDE